MAEKNVADSLERGIQTAQAGNKLLARLHLLQAAELDPNNVNCWLWLAWVAESPAAATHALERLLEIQPNHALAQTGLQWSRALAAFDIHAPAEIEATPEPEAVEVAADLDETPATPDSVPPANAEPELQQDSDEETTSPAVVNGWSEEEVSEESEAAVETVVPDEPVATPDNPATEALEEPTVSVDLTSPEELARDDFPNVEQTAEPTSVDDFGWHDVPVGDAPTFLYQPEEQPNGLQDLDEVGRASFAETFAEIPESESQESQAPAAESPVVIAESTSTVQAEATEATQVEHNDAEFPVGIVLEQVEQQFAAVPEVAPDADENLETTQEANATQDVINERTEFEPDCPVEWTPAPPSVTNEEPCEPVASESQTTADASSDILPEPVYEVTIEETPEPKTEAPRVLVVDDSPTVRKLVAMTLEKQGYEVSSAEDGIDALKQIAEVRPQLILMDINMPKLGGYQLCKLVKKHEQTRHIPVVMLSGKDGMFDKMRGKLVGCVDYVTKPFDPALLSEKVEKHLLRETADANG